MKHVTKDRRAYNREYARKRRKDPKYQEYQRKYRMEHSLVGENGSYFRQYYQKHKQKYRERERKRYEKIKNNPLLLEKYRDKLRDWRKKNRERFLLLLRARRQRVRALGVIDIGAWLSKCEQLGNKCQMCGKKERLSFDHIIPITRGGDNSIGNLQPLCVSCNSSKGNKLPSELYHSSKGNKFSIILN